LKEHCNKVRLSEEIHSLPAIIAIEKLTRQINAENYKKYVVIKLPNPTS
jgi:hypothetical protein